MKIVGLITEYNPFHKGHEYHIKKAKELTGADACVVIMSGNYVQRGTPAFMDKHTRTSIALDHGADIIFELPIPFSCASAEYFATAAVTLLHKMGVITHICFGAECDDLTTLKRIASILTDAKFDSSHPINHAIKANTKVGMTYAAARADALKQYIEDDDLSILDMPNNILGIEYLKALKQLNSSIIPIAITRTKALYHDNKENNCLYSASSVRAALMNTTDNTVTTEVLKELSLFSNQYQLVLDKTAPVTENDFSNIISEKLLSLCLTHSSENTLTDYVGIDNDLANRLSNHSILLTHEGYSDLIDKLKTKNIAYSSISRALLAITLGIKKININTCLSNGIATYIRLLGFTKKHSAVLNEIKKNGSLTIIGQLSEINDNTSLTETDRQLLSHSLYCDELYNAVIRNKYNCSFPNEYQRKIIIR